MLYVPAIGVPVEIADLTGHLGDMEYEYKALEAAYARIRNDIEISKGKWSRDWGEFDWQGLQSKFEKGEDVELSPIWKYPNSFRVLTYRLSNHLWMLGTVVGNIFWNTTFLK